MVKSINILIALRWVAKAWSQVKPETITKCFRKAGILNADLDVISCELGGDDDPFLDADMRTEVQGLIEQTMPADGHCHVDEYLNDDLPVCMETDNASWEVDFLQQLGQEEQQISDDEPGNEDDIDLPAPKLRNFKEAIQSLDDVQQFLESKGYIEEALKIGSAVDTLTILKLKSSQQATLHNYFT